MKTQNIEFNKRNGRPRAGTEPLIKGFLRSLLSHPSLDTGKNLVTEQAGLEFDSVNGGEFQRAVFEEEYLVERFRNSKRTLEKLEAKKEKIKSSIRAGSAKGKGNKTVFSDWAAWDKFSFMLTTGFMGLMLLTGTANVFANLMSSGNPVFLENPVLALLLSALFPAGALSFKVMRDFMEEDSSRKRYTQFIFSVTILALLFWVDQFAIHFPGIANEIDLDNLGESSETDSLMVGAQLIAELLVSSSLYLAASDLAKRYSPDIWVPNPAHIEIQDSLKEQLTEHEKLIRDLGQTRGRLRELEAQRRAFTNRILSKFMHMKGRFDQSSLNADLDSL